MMNSPQRQQSQIASQQQQPSPSSISHQQSPTDQARFCFSANHNYYIHDVQYDFYGKRMATCSSDKTIRVWDMNTDGSGWRCTSDWKAHNGPVRKIQWAHPEFGQVIASCSEDHTCHIWEEVLSDEKSASSTTTSSTSNMNNNTNSSSGTTSSGGGTNKKPKLQWTLKASLVDSPQRIEDMKFAPRHHGLKLATSSGDGRIRIYEAPDVMNLSYWTVNQEIVLQQKNSVARCLSWNTSRTEAPMLVIGESNNVLIYKLEDRQWKLLHRVGTHEQEVNDVAWAPNMGRSYHLIASASKDGTACIWKLRTGTCDLMDKYVLVDHKAEVWRVEWNVTGTVLATSGDDGMVRLYSMVAGKWQCTSTMNAQP